MGSLATCQPRPACVLALSANHLAALPPRRPMTGAELRALVFDKWGCSYDVTLQRRGKRMYL